jgi:hypothetical protein
MGGPTGVPQKPATTTKDVLLDFMAGGTGLFFFSNLNKNIFLFFFIFSCMYILIMFKFDDDKNSFRELSRKQLLRHLNV